MIRPFEALRGKFAGRSMTQEDVAAAIGVSKSCIANRMNARLPWTIEEIYKLCDLFEIPEDEISFYFPRGGGIKRKRSIAA